MVTESHLLYWSLLHFAVCPRIIFGVNGGRLDWDSSQSSLPAIQLSTILGLSPNPACLLYNFRPCWGWVPNPACLLYAYRPYWGWVPIQPACCTLIDHIGAESQIQPPSSTLTDHIGAESQSSVPALHLPTILGLSPNPASPLYTYRPTEQ